MTALVCVRSHRNLRGGTFKASSFSLEPGTMIYLFKVYVLVVVVVFGTMLALFLAAAVVAAAFEALRADTKAALTLWHTRSTEPFSVWRHLKTKKVVNGGAS